MKKNCLHPERALIPFQTLLLGAFLFGACGKKPVGKSPEEAKVLFVDSVAAIPSIGPTRKAPFSFDMSLKAETEEKTRRLKASMRLAPDSLLWASVSPSFGIEVARILLRNDSLFMIDRMRDRSFKGEASRMGQRFGVPLERDLLESALLGRPALTHDKGYLLYKGGGDTLHYRPVMNPELKERSGLGRMGDPFDSLRMEAPSIMRDSLDRAIEKEGVRYLPFYWTADSGKVLTRFCVIDLHERSVMDLRYPSYQDLDSTRIPAEVKARVRSQKGISTFDIGIQGVSGADSLSYPFSIPDGYAPIRP